MRPYTSVLFAALAAVSSPAAAAPAAPPAAAQPKAAIDPAALAAANRLLEAMDYDKLIDRMMEAMIADAEANLPKRLEASAKMELPDDLKARLTALIAGTMRRLAAANRPEMRRGTALIYARHFTAAEIDHMIVMMRDPVMVKMQAEMPQIMTEAMVLSQANIEREMPAMIDQLKSAIADYYRDKGEQPPS